MRPPARRSAARLPGRLVGGGLLVLVGLWALGGPCASPARAQSADSTRKEVDIEQAGRASQRVVDGERVRTLSTDVRLLQDQTHLRADSVIQYLDQDLVLLLGRVLIAEEGDTLTADSVRYNSRTKIGHALGDVRLSDGDVEVFAPSAVHFVDEKRTTFDENVRLVDSLTVLTSREGEYFSEEKRAEFYLDVVLREDRTYLEADSVTYWRETEVSHGRGRVFIERIGGEDPEASSDAPPDSSIRTFLFGEEAYNDNRIGYSRIERNALLLQLRRDSARAVPDTMLIRAVVLEAVRDDSLNRLIAVDSVRIWQKDLAAVADSAVYDRIEQDSLSVMEESRLFKNPFAWFETYQVSGDTIRVTARDEDVDSLLVYGNAFTAERDSVLERIQQMRGRDLIGLFRQDSIHSLTIGPTAEAIYFRKDNENRPQGAARTSGDRITLRFRNNELHEMAVIQHTENLFYSENLLPDPFQLDGYVWVPERKPARAALLRDARLRRVIEGFDLQEVPIEDAVPLPEPHPIPPHDP